MDKALEIASRITNPITASAFAVAFLGVALYLVVKLKNRAISWLLAAGLIVVGVAPLAASTILALRGVYRVTVTVVNPANQPVTDAEVDTPIGGKNKTPSGWEISIPPQAKPEDGKVKIYAKAPNAFLAGETTITLGKDYFPSTEIHLIPPPSVKVSGEVLDKNGRGVAGANVVLPKCSLATQTNQYGLFSFDSCVAQDQMVEVRAEKSKLSASKTEPAGGVIQLVLRRE